MHRHQMTSDARLQGRQVGTLAARPLPRGWIWRRGRTGTGSAPSAMVAVALVAAALATTALCISLTASARQLQGTLDEPSLAHIFSSLALDEIGGLLAVAALLDIPTCTALLQAYGEQRGIKPGRARILVRWLHSWTLAAAAAGCSAAQISQVHHLLLPTSLALRASNHALRQALISLWGGEEYTFT